MVDIANLSPSALQGQDAAIVRRGDAPYSVELVPLSSLTSASATWGTIGGTLAAQSDLQTALNGKADLSHTHTASQITDSTAAGRTLLTAADALAQRTALSVESTAQLDARDTANRSRANHTGTQSAATITGLATVATSGSASDLSAGILPAARFDDTAHGARSGGTLHAAATTSVAGFMSAADKTKLDGVAAGANTGTVTSVSVSGGTTGLTVTGSPITTSGTITLAGTLAVANGGTGGTDQATARTGLGLGTMATQAASAVAITGGTINGATVGATTRASGAFTTLVASGVEYLFQPNPTALSVATSLTAAQILAKIISYTGAAATLTMPTGTAIETGVLASLPVDTAFELTVINTGTGAATLAVNTGVTALGSLVVTNGTSGTFRIRKTATNTYVMYRL